MDVTITSKEVAESIATQVGDATGKDCGVYTNEVSALIVHHNRVVARITPLFGVMAVVPVGGEFAGIITEMPLQAKTLGDLEEVTRAMKKATAHVLSAAMAQ